MLLDCDQMRKRLDPQINEQIASSKAIEIPKRELEGSRKFHYYLKDTIEKQSAKLNIIERK